MYERIFIYIRHTGQTVSVLDPYEEEWRRVVFGEDGRLFPLKSLTKRTERIATEKPDRR